MTDEWEYDKDEAFRLSVPMAEALATPADHIVYRSLDGLQDSEIGVRLISKALDKGCRVAIDANLPAYGLVIPDDQTVDGTPLVIMSGDLNDWRNDFGIYNWGHELTHIYQMDSRFLRNFPSWGVSYESTAPIVKDSTGFSHVLSLQKMRVHQEMAEVILSERMADVIGVCVALQFKEKNPDTGVTGILGYAKEIKGLFTAVSEGRKKGTQAVISADLMNEVMQAESFSEDEWRYYMRYGRHISNQQNGHFLQSFNRAAAKKMANGFLVAQCRMAESLIGDNKRGYEL